ncbi:MAG TPA: hypothetical protein VGK96_24650 [Candidatus Sulfotelmatobacter sp.]|jgi:hypothetical protein
MERDAIKLTLLRASDDPAQLSDEYQTELYAVQEALRKRGLQVTGFAAHPAGDTHLGQFLITLGPPVIAAVAAVAGAWVQARYGRKVRLKFGDVEAEGRTPAEIEELLKRIAEFRETKPKGTKDHE